VIAGCRDLERGELCATAAKRIDAAAFDAMAGRGMNGIVSDDEANLFACRPLIS
jgi:hypothetical protein